MLNHIRRLFGRQPKDPVLGWVNMIREQHLGLGPLASIPDGKIGQAHACPISNALNQAGVSRNSVCFYEDQHGMSRELNHLPAEVSQWIEDFDTGRHPDHIAYF